MPFQSEKQRRYLWANEPEIARDWTDTYGSRIRKDNGGMMDWADQGGMKNYLGEQPMVNAPQNWRAGPNTPPTELAYVTRPERNLILQANMHGSLGQGPNEGPSGIMSLDSQGDYTPDLSPSGGGHTPGEGGDFEAENIANQQAARQKAVLTGKIQKNPTTGEWEAGRNLGRGENVMGMGLGSGPKIGGGLGLTRSGAGPNIGNWASGFAGSKIGGGLGSMLFGPWGAILGALFGRGVGKRAWQARQTDEKETAKDILLGQNTLLSNLFNKKKTPTNIGGEGIQTIDIRDKFNRLAQPDDRFANARRAMTQVGLDEFRPMTDEQVQKYGQLTTGNINRGVYDPYDTGIDYRSDLEKMAESSGVRDRMEPEDTDYWQDLYREGRNRKQYYTTPEMWKRVYG